MWGKQLKQSLERKSLAADKYYIQKGKGLSDWSFYLKKLEKEQSKSKVSRRNKKKAEIKWKTVEKNSWNKKLIFDMIN